MEFAAIHDYGYTCGWQVRKERKEKKKKNSAQERSMVIDFHRNTLFSRLGTHSVDSWALLVQGPNNAGCPATFGV